MTSPADWHRLEHLFHQASSLSDDQRLALVEEVRNESPSLAEELESLLRFAADDATRIGSAVGSALAASREADGVAGGPAVGDVLGRYRLVEVIGRGGLSTVFRAERADRQFELEVAVKLIRRELDSDETRERLHRERQILATLEHPNIARLIDGGTSPNGMPYFVMEHVDGEDLERYCETRSLSIDPRIELFLQVCAAVEHAHRRLVIHRDLKPANILVTREGVPKLLDFGIAKPLDPIFATPYAATAPGTRMLTMAFASPEQVRGEALGTATDVYSLGVVLYRLLCGQHPYSLDPASSAEMERRIADQPVPRPSDVVELGAHSAGAGRRLRRRLAGDLDTIVLEAIRKEQDRRYPSVGALAEDLRRHLEGRPVHARRDTVGYRVGRLVKRHKLASTLVVGLVASTAFYTVRVAAERDHARQEAAKVAQVSEMLIGLFEASDPEQARGETVTASEILARGAERIRTELADQPEIQGTMMGVIGRVYTALGLLTSARPLLEDALEIRLRSLGEQDPAVAASRNELGELLVALGELPRAESQFQQALTTRLEALGEDDPATWTSMSNLAVTLAYQGDLVRAEALFRRVLALRQRYLGEEDPAVATSLNNLADVVDRKGDRVAAEALYRQALALKRRLKGADAPGVALVLNNLARVTENRGDDAAAHDLYREALELNRQLLPMGHPDVAFGIHRMASTARRLGRLEEAEALLREGLETQAGSGEGSARMMAAFLETLVATLLDGGRAEEAVAAAREGLARRMEAYPDGHWRVEVARSLLGASLLASGERQEAAALLRDSHERLVTSRGEDDPVTREARRRRDALD